MNDFFWFIISGIIFIVLSLLFIVLGLLIWKKRKINIVMSQYCERVSEDNKNAYCRLFGIGMSVIGIGFGISGICTVLLQSVLAFIPMAVGMILGLSMLIWAIVKYNR